MPRGGVVGALAAVPAGCGAELELATVVARAGVVGALAAAPAGRGEV